MLIKLGVLKKGLYYLCVNTTAGPQNSHNGENVTLKYYSYDINSNEMLPNNLGSMSDYSGQRFLFYVE
jgi:hypothetical protein